MNTSTIVSIIVVVLIIIAALIWWSNQGTTPAQPGYNNGVPTTTNTGAPYMPATGTPATTPATSTASSSTSTY